MTHAESNILLLLPRGVHAFIADVGLRTVLQGLQFEYKDAYLAYHNCLEVDWDDEDCIGWFSCVRTSGDVPDISAWKVNSKRRTVGDVQIK